MKTTFEKKNSKVHELQELKNQTSNEQLKKAIDTKTNALTNNKIIEK